MLEIHFKHVTSSRPLHEEQCHCGSFDQVVFLQEPPSFYLDTIIQSSWRPTITSFGNSKNCLSSRPKNLSPINKSNHLRKQHACLKKSHSAYLLALSPKVPQVLELQGPRQAYLLSVQKSWSYRIYMSSSSATTSNRQTSCRVGLLKLAGHDATFFQQWLSRIVH